MREMETPPNEFDGIADRLVVFGYGSLIWRPNFVYAKRSVGFIKGYLRRFYQGNTTHRGTRERPGRVATLIPADTPNARVWGCAYEIVGEDEVKAALEHLNEREVINGGYEFVQTDFHPVRPDPHMPLKFKAWVCVHIAEAEPSESNLPRRMSYDEIPGNLYLGEAPLDVQANQIASARGICGPNSEYVFRVAAFMRTEVPITQCFADDPYLFVLERLIRNRMMVHTSEKQFTDEQLDIVHRSANPQKPCAFDISLFSDNLHNEHLPATLSNAALM